MRFSFRTMGAAPGWFDSHRTDLVGLAVLAAVIVFIVLFVKIGRE